MPSGELEDNQHRLPETNAVQSTLLSTGASDDVPAPPPVAGPHNESRPPAPLPPALASTAPLRYVAADTDAFFAYAEDGFLGPPPPGWGQEAWAANRRRFRGTQEPRREPPPPSITHLRTLDGYIEDPINAEDFPRYSHQVAELAASNENAVLRLLESDLFRQELHLEIIDSLLDGELYIPNSAAARGYLRFQKRRGSTVRVATMWSNTAAGTLDRLAREHFRTGSESSGDDRSSRDDVEEMAENDETDETDEMDETDEEDVEEEDSTSSSNRASDADAGSDDGAGGEGSDNGGDVDAALASANISATFRDNVARFV